MLTRLLHPAEPEDPARPDADVEPAFGRLPPKLSRTQPVEEARRTAFDQADLKHLPDKQQGLRRTSIPGADFFCSRPHRPSQQLPTAVVQVGHHLQLSVAGREMLPESGPRLPCFLGPERLRI